MQDLHDICNQKIKWKKVLFDWEKILLILNG